MKKTYHGGTGVFVVVIVIVLAALAFAISLLTGKEPAQVAQEAAETATGKATEVVKEKGEEVMEKATEEGKEMVGEVMKETGEKMMDGAGVYEEYAAEKVAANDGAVIFFGADWCPTCRALEKDIQENVGSIPAGVAILRADYDAETELKKKYGVTTQHTLVQVDANGEKISLWRGGNTLDTVLAKVQ